MLTDEQAISTMAPANAPINMPTDLPAVADIRTRIELAIATIDPDTDLDTVCAAISLLDAVSRFCTDQKKILYERLEPYIRQHGEFMLGTDRFFVNVPSEVKCQDMPEAVRKLYAVCETVNTETGEVKMDLNVLIDCLSVNAIKQSKAKQVLPAAVFDRLFKRITKPHVSREGGKSLPTVQRVDTQFIEG